MPEDNTANEGQNQDQKPEGGEKPAESGADDKKPDTKVEGEGNTGNEGEQNEGKGDKKPEGEKPPKPEEKPQLGNEDDGQDPPTRKRMTPKDWIIKRKDEKIADLKKAADRPEGEEEDDEELHPEDRETIAKVVEPMLKPLYEKTIQAEDEKEIAQFLKENPEFAPYEKRARRFIAHPSRANLPVESVFYEVAGKDLIKIGAERERAAIAKANESKSGGGTNRGGAAGKSVWDMSPEEFEAEQNRVRQGQPQP